MPPERELYIEHFRYNESPPLDNTNLFCLFMIFSILLFIDLQGLVKQR